MRRLAAIVVSCLAAAGVLYAQRTQQSAGWETYAGDAQGRRYSPLTQINRDNVGKLTLAWQYGVADASTGSQGAAGRSQAVPIFVRGVLYTSTARRTIVALDPATGKEIWKYELEKGGAPNRGVSYWPGDTRSPARIFAGTTDGRLLALDAATGMLIPTFGDHGVINLRAGVADKFPNKPYMMASPGLVYNELIVTGAQGQEDDPDGPAMDVRAWNVRTGALAWTFHTIPIRENRTRRPGRRTTG
jgi:quinoprotein glucose dehydrogenase